MLKDNCEIGGRGDFSIAAQCLDEAISLLQIELASSDNYSLDDEYEHSLSSESGDSLTDLIAGEDD